MCFLDCFTLLSKKKVGKRQLNRNWDTFSFFGLSQKCKPWHLWVLSHGDSSSVGGSKVILTAALPGAETGENVLKVAVQGNSDHALREPLSSLPSGELRHWLSSRLPQSDLTPHRNIWMNSGSNVWLECFTRFQLVRYFKVYHLSTISHDWFSSVVFGMGRKPILR